MRSVIVGLIFAVLAATTPAGQEKAMLTTPTTQTTLDYQVAEVTLTRLPSWRVSVTYVDNLGRVYFHAHDGESAEALVIALNKADLSVKNLERRILEHLVADAAIPPAAISGVPR